MFEAVELGNRVDKATWKAEVPDLRVDLLNLQFELRTGTAPPRRSVLVLLAGSDRPGCEEVVDRMNEWLDARYLGTHVFPEPERFERERPRFWRYWRALPARGEVGLFFGAWPITLCADRLRGRIDESGFQRELAHARRLERALVADGTVILKLWLHVPREVLAARLEASAAGDDDGRHGPWQTTDADWRLLDHWDEALPVAEAMIRESGSAEAPWHLVESTDERYRDLRVFRLLRDALAEAVAAKPPAAPNGGAGAPAPVEAGTDRTVLDTVDPHARLEYDEYAGRRRALQDRLHRAAAAAHRAKVPTVLVFEGWDAAGKGGAIRRITRALPARLYRVIPVSAPDEAERAHHYLWRFWRDLPRAGGMVVFDRSWYGRVLVERVEGYATPADWRRAYDEINDFEGQLIEYGTVVRKFFLHLDRQEQRRRFDARAKTPYKKYKLTDEDRRNRAKWDEYVAAVHEMVVRTSTEHAPWTLVAANQKRFARIEVLETLVRALEEALPEPGRV